MDIDFLRSIGLSLKKIIPPLIWKLHGTLPIGVGASGDKTYLVDKKAEETVIRAIEKGAVTLIYHLIFPLKSIKSIAWKWCRNTRLQEEIFPCF